MLLVFKDDLEKTYLKERFPKWIDILTWWDQMREKYLSIVDLFERMTNFIYPLILSCYWINIYLVINNVDAYYYLYLIN